MLPSCCSRLRLCVGYFIYFKFTRVLFYLMFLMDTLVQWLKEVKKFTSKGISNIYYWEKQTFSKLRFCRKENLKKRTSFEEQKGTRYIQRLFWHYCLHLSSFYKTLSQISFNLFCSGDKRQSSLVNEVDFTEIMNVSPNILAKN